MASLVFLKEYIFEPDNCPKKKAGTVKKNVISSNPLPNKNLNKIIKGIEKCMARKNCNENL